MSVDSVREFLLRTFAWPVILGVLVGCVLAEPSPLSAGALTFTAILFVQSLVREAA